jgi:hypothetical protein
MNPVRHLALLFFVSAMACLAADALTAQAGPPTTRPDDKARTDESDGAASRSAVLYCTTMLHLDPGRAGPKPARPPVRIRVRFRAVPLSPETLASIRTNPRARAFYNGRVLRRLARFANDVPVRLGGKTLKPSTWDAGFVCLTKNRWHFVVLDRDGEAAATAPIAVTAGEAEIPCLSISLVPTGKPGGVTLAVRYGKMRGTVEMAVVGGEDEEEEKEK